MSFEVSEEQKLILDEVDRACKELRPFEDRAYLSSSFNDHLVPIFSKAQLLGLPVSRRYGNGQGADILTYALALERIGREGTGVRTFLSGHVSLGQLTVQKWGSEQQKERFLPPATRGEKVMCFGLMGGRLSVAAGCLGVIEDCIDEAVAYARQRVQHGKPIGKHQLVQRHIGLMATNLEAARNLTYKAALLKQRSNEEPRNVELRDQADIMIAKSKLFASNASFDAADRTVQIFGSSGYSFETRAPRHLVDTRVCRIYEGTDEIMVQKIAVGLLGPGFEAYK